MPPKTKPPEQRFWPNVRMTSGCWEWTGSKSWGGYGKMYWKSERLGRARGTSKPAHKFAYEAMYGPVAEGLQLDHLCRNPGCVNPDHLEPVTPRVNQLRGNTFAAANTAKTHCVRGHEFSPSNTYLHQGHRHCKTCKSERQKRAQRQNAND